MTTAPSIAVDDLVVRDFELDGYAVVRDAVTADQRTAAYQAATELLGSSITTGRDRGADGKDGFRGVINLHDAFLPLIANPAILAPVITLLNSTNLHLLSSHLIALPSVPSGEPRSIRTPERHGWHRDMFAVADDLGPSSTPRLAVKAALYLTPPAPDAGITMVLPGSHRDTGPVTVPPGAIDPPHARTPVINTTDVLLFENRTWHAGGLNTSGRPRIALMLQYGYRWLAPVDDPSDALRARTDLTPVQHQLLGARDRNPDGSLAKGAGAQALHNWWRQCCTDTSDR